MLGFNPAQALRPTSLPEALESDFLDPTLDGSDVVWYSAAFRNIAPGTTQNRTALQIDAGVDFYWMMTTLQADIAGASVAAAAYVESSIVNPLVTIHFRDESAGKNLGNLKLPVGSLCGFGERCYRLVQPRRIPGSTLFTFSATSLDAAATYANLFIVLHGYTFPAANLPVSGS